MIEDWIFPSLKDIEREFFTQPNKLVFITGHARSGTTNLHHALSAIEGVTTGIMFDLMFPSLILKYINTPLKLLLDKFVLKKISNADKTPNHKIGVNEPLEDDMFTGGY